MHAVQMQQPYGWVSPQPSEPRVSRRRGASVGLLVAAVPAAPVAAWFTLNGALDVGILFAFTCLVAGVLSSALVAPEVSRHGNRRWIVLQALVAVIVGDVLLAVALIVSEIGGRSFRLEDAAMAVVSYSVFGLVIYGLPMLIATSICSIISVKLMLRDQAWEPMIGTG